MSKSHCVDCGRAHDTREMCNCTGCGAYVCSACAGRQSQRCTECAGQGETVATSQLG